MENRLQQQDLKQCFNETDIRNLKTLNWKLSVHRNNNKLNIQANIAIVVHVSMNQPLSQANRIVHESNFVKVNICDCSLKLILLAPSIIIFGSVDYRSVKVNVFKNLVQIFNVFFSGTFVSLKLAEI